MELKPFRSLSYSFRRICWLLSLFLPLIIIFATFLFFGCSNMQEGYVYGGIIKGRAVLIGEQSENYSGVKVNLNSSVVSSSVTTLADGRFVFTDLPDGIYEIICSKNPFSTANVININVNKSNENNVGDLLLTPPMPPDAPEVGN